MEPLLAEAEQHETRAYKVRTPPEVEDLLRQLIEHVGNEGQPYSLDQDGEIIQEIMFDIEIDDIRYTLMRSYVRLCYPLISLSPREKEIVRLVAKGHPNKVIARVLDISPWTVSTHLRRVFAKLGVSSRAEMVARALNDELLPDKSVLSILAAKT